MAVLAYSLGKREINQYFNIKNAKLISSAVVVLLFLCHTASRYYGGKCCVKEKLAPAVEPVFRCPATPLPIAPTSHRSAGYASRVDVLPTRLRFKEV